MIYYLPPLILYVTTLQIMFCLLSFLVFGVTNDCNELDTSTRSTITLTLLLSAVAFKVSVASSLPQVPYFTFLDSFMWLLISFISLLAIENIAWPAASCTNRRWDLGQEHEVYVMYGLLFLFVSLVGTMSLIAWRIRQANDSLLAKKKEEMNKEGTSSPPPSSSSSLSTTLSTTTSPPTSLSPTAEKGKPKNASPYNSKKIYAAQEYN
jgi:hypothetical protein